MPAINLPTDFVPVNKPQSERTYKPVCINLPIDPQKAALEIVHYFGAEEALNIAKMIANHAIIAHPTRIRRRPFTSEERKEILQRIARGESQCSIARSMGLVQPTISRFLRRDNKQPKQQESMYKQT